jgi:hypothetical protein
MRGESLEDMRINDFLPPKSVVRGGIIWPLTSPTIKNLCNGDPEKEKRTNFSFKVLPKELKLIF